MTNRILAALALSTSLATTAFADPNNIVCEIHDVQVGEAVKNIRPFPGHYEEFASFRGLTFKNHTSSKNLIKIVVWKDEGQMNFDLPVPAVGETARVAILNPGFNFAIYCTNSNPTSF